MKLDHDRIKKKVNSRPNLPSGLMVVSTDGSCRLRITDPTAESLLPHALIRRGWELDETDEVTADWIKANKE